MKQFKFNERQRFSIRKFSIGAASVLLGSVFFAVSSVEDVQAAEKSQNVVSANENKQTPNPLISSNSSTTGVSTKEANTSVSDANVENKPEGDVVGSSKETQESVPVVSTISDSNERKLALSKLIEEIDGKFTNGKYASKTEDSVNKLKAALEEARSVLSNATTESELTQAHSKLVTATTQLKTKPTEKKEELAVDTTNGKATVGKKATNTEKASDSNSIANSGSRDERHGKALDRSNLFRTDPATTDTDPSANQTYTAPAENADLKTLADKLLGLGATVENNAKLANEMNTLGDSKQVEKGTVKEINEFGGWKAVDGGVFAIARRTEEGVYPLETINSTLNDTVWLREQAFDRDTEYTLLLSKSRTRANRDEEVFDGSKYKGTGEGGGITKNVARYKGIEKTFTAYSTAEGSDVIVKFKPGYVGDSDGSKANYKVQVYSITGNQESLVYETTFDPSRNINDTKQIVTRATDGTNRETIRISNTPNSVPKEDDRLATRTNFIGKREAEKLMARPENLPNGKAGTFTSKPIALPQGADHYKVRISLADQNRTGMSYQAWDEKYSIPVTGADFSIAQDTSRVAKSLLQRVYDKLLATVDADKRGKTPETQKAYQDKLDAIKALLDGELKSTDDYKRLVQPTLDAQEALKVDKSALTTSKGELDDLVNDDPTPGKTPETVSEYNKAKSAAEEEARKAKLVIDNEHATVDQVAQAVADVRAKRAELRAARALLVVAATEAQKTKLQNDSNALTEADKTNKTPKSIAEYEKKYETLKGALTAAKAQAKAVLDKTVNAGKVEATDAQIEVDKIKAELDKAAALLKEKGNTAELENAKNDLSSYITQQTNDNVTAGKTKDSQDAYAIAKTAADKAVEDAAAVIASENSTVEDVANALADIRVKKAALEATKAALVAKVTPEQKTALGQADADLAVLGDADLAGKTKATADAYKAETGKLTAAIEEAKREATAILADPENKTQAEAALVQSKIEALKAKLDAAKAKLVAKADTTELSTAKADLDTKAKEVVSTEGKTKATVDAYNNAKAAAEEAVTAAEAVINDENVTAKAVAEALANVNAKKAALEAAKAALVDKVTPEQKTALGNADTDLAVLGDADLAGKTKATADAYKAETGNLTADIEAAKREAAAILADPENKTQAEAALVQSKIEALKAKLEAEKAKLVAKADTRELSTAKADLDTKAKEVVPTEGKTKATVDAYNEAKKAAEAAVTAAEAVINDENVTAKAVAEALANVNAKKAALEAAKTALVDKITQDQKDDLANAEENLKLADTTGKTKDSIKAYNDEVAKLNDELVAAKQAAKDLVDKGDNAGELEAYRVQAKINKLKSKLAEAAKLLKDIDKSAAKKEVEDAATKATDAIVANNDLTPEQKEAAKAKVADAANKANAEIDKATTENDVTAAKNAGKFAIEKEAAKAEVEATKAAKEKAINANDKLSDDEKRAANEAIAKAADAAEKAIDAATDQATVEGAKTTGIKAVTAVNPVGKEKALDAIQKATEDKLAEIDKNDKLSAKEKAEAKAKVAKAAIDAVNAIIAATDQTAVDSAQTTGTAAVEAVNPVGKEKALAAIDKALAAKEKAIEANDKLSDAEKQAAKEAAKKAADEAKKAINDAQNQEAVDNAKNAGTAAVEAVNPVGKEKALDAIQKATEDKLAEIDRDDKLSDKEKDKAKAEVAKAAIDAVNAINAATDQAAVDAKQAEGTKAVSEVNPVGKDKAKAEIEATKAAKEKAIDSNPDLTDAQKAEAKAKIAEAAKKAIDAIDKAKTTEEVASAKESGKLAIEKEAEKAEIEAAKAAKEKAIDARTDLTDDEKAKAKAKVAEEAKKAIEAIGNAKTHNDASAKTETGKDDIKKINPIGGKETAKKAIDEALAAKEKAIDARTDLLPEEKEAAKKAAREEAEAAKNAIDKATTSDDIKKVLDNGLDKIAKVNPLGAKEEAKKSIEERLADKEKEIDARTDLTPEEKAKAKALAREEAKAAKDAIDKATSIEAIEKALRPFLYQIDQDALVFDRPELDIKAALQASVTGVVTVERGKAISQADIIAKLNLPETVTVMNIDLPDTTTLGRKFAKVTLRLPGGKETTVNVPVEVTPQKNKDVIPSYNGGNDGNSGNNAANNTDAKVNKAKLEGAIHQLDELIIKESAKLDAETAKEANDLLADAKKVFADLKASQDEVDAMVKRIEDFMAKVAPATNHATPANDQVAQTTAVVPATTQAAANASQTASSQANARKAAKELPNTGTADSTVAMVAAAASALLGLGLAGRRRKEDEEA